MCHSVSVVIADKELGLSSGESGSVKGCLAEGRGVKFSQLRFEGRTHQTLEECLTDDSFQVMSRLFKGRRK